MFREYFLNIHLTFKFGSSKNFAGLKVLLIITGVGGKIERGGSGSVLLPNGGAGGGFSPKSYFPATTSETLHRLKTVPKGDKCPSFSPCTAESSNSRTSFRSKKEVTAEAFRKDTPVRTNTRYHLVSNNILSCKSTITNTNLLQVSITKVPSTKKAHDIIL